MNNKKMLLPIIIILIGTILVSAVGLVLSICKKPVVTEMEFPFSITYEYKGETKTVNDTFSCSFTGGDEIRFWEGTVKSSNKESCHEILVDEKNDGQLTIITNLFAGYLMGDPYYDDSYSEYLPYEPYAAFFDLEGVEYSDEETLEKHDLKIINYEYPEPIENEFVFSHIARLDGDTSFKMALCSVVFLLLTIIFIKKSEDVTYTAFDKKTIVLNFVVGIVLLPFITVVGTFTDINGDGTAFIYQISYCVPAVTALCLALSIALRRKGFKKESMVVQFVGPMLFVLTLIADTLILIF